jgi:hypothetical protein
MSRLTRRRLIAGAAPLIAAGPLAKLALADGQTTERLATHEGTTTHTTRSATRR